MGEREGQISGKKWRLVETRRPRPWVWEGCTFAPVPVFLGGSPSPVNPFCVTLQCRPWESHPYQQSPGEWESGLCGPDWVYQRFLPRVCRWHSRLSHLFRLVMQVSFCPQIFSSFSKGQPLPPLQVPEQVVEASWIHLLRKHPKWMRRPANVSFAVSGVCVYVCEVYCVPSLELCSVGDLLPLPLSQIRSHFTMHTESYSFPLYPFALLAAPVLSKRNWLL